MMPRQKRPWSLREFKGIAGPGIADEVLRPLMNMCNISIQSGLTRDQVTDTLAQVAKDAGPEGLRVADLMTALVQRAYPVSRAEQQAFGAPETKAIVREELDAAMQNRCLDH
jgi:hypothetical protein